MSSRKTSHKPSQKSLNLRDPGFIRIFEVGPRDGIQNEKNVISIEDKIQFVQSLIDVGVVNLELGSFVRPDRVPQMADTESIFEAIRQGRIQFGKAQAWSLVPNMKGFERAAAVGAQNIALFTAATDSFAQRNIGMTVDASIEEFDKIIQLARNKDMHIRGYISAAFGCPFEGIVPAKKTLKVVEKLAKIGVDEISIGDTIGVATPKQIEEVMKPALKWFGAELVAGHFHDTRGSALANALRAVELGLTTLDSSAGGLGGCPFAPGASGNVATEDLLYMLHGMGFKTGIDLERLCQVSLQFLMKIGRPVFSKYLQAYQSRCSV